VAGHPDQIQHREQGAAGGDGVSGLGLQVLDGGGGDDGDGQAAVGAQLGVAQLATHQGAEGVVLALAVTAGVAGGDLFGGFAIHVRGLVVGVAHAGGGEFGEPDVDLGAQFGGGDEFHGC